MTALPPYTLRRSPRARYLRIKVCPREGVVVILPRGADPAQAEAFLAQRRDWVERALAQVAAQAQRQARRREQLPERIVLPALAEELQVVYRHRAIPARAQARASGLLITGPLEDRAGLRAALRRWLLRTGQAHLPGWLARVSGETALGYRAVRVRAQRTLWGSCTRQGNISLNCKLLLLPPALVRYVMIHELAHTRHLNHSARFWGLVERFEPCYRERERALREAGRALPAWVEE